MNGKFFILFENVVVTFPPLINTEYFWKRNKLIFFFFNFKNHYKHNPHKKSSAPC